MRFADSRVTRLENYLASMKEQLSEHLDAINKNSDEIQGCYSFLMELESKIAKIEERVDKISKNSFGVVRNQDLSRIEEEVFLALYLQHGPATVRFIARRLGLAEHTVEHLVDSLVMKGIPVRKEFVGSEVFVSMDEAFKELQAREKIVNVKNSISQQVLPWASR